MPNTAFLAPLVANAVGADDGSVGIIASLVGQGQPLPPRVDSSCPLPEPTPVSAVYDSESPIFIFLVDRYPPLWPRTEFPAPPPDGGTGVGPVA